MRRAITICVLLAVLVIAPTLLWCHPEPAEGGRRVSTGVHRAGAAESVGFFGPRNFAAPRMTMPSDWQPQQVIDRIVARVDDDIVTLSEVRELGRYQQLVEGRSEDERKLLDRIIDQRILTREAAAARFAAPSEASVDRAVAALEKNFASPEAYRARLKSLGLSSDAVRRLVANQVYLARYLDYRFRPAAQFGAEEIEKYYREQLVPQLAARGQAAPPLESVADQIRELLTQREISDRAEKWLEEARTRVRIEILGEDRKP
jgi:parvulin-like peptidyl-prolyl isomerase